MRRALVIRSLAREGRPTALLLGSTHYKGSEASEGSEASMGVARAQRARTESVPFLAHREHLRARTF